MKKQLYAKVSKGEVIEVIEITTQERPLYHLIVNGVIKNTSSDLKEIIERYRKI